MVQAVYQALLIREPRDLVSESTLQESLDQTHSETTYGIQMHRSTVASKA